MDALAVERGLADNTLQAYRRDLRRYSAFLARRGVNDGTRVSEKDVESFLAHLSRSKTPHGTRYAATTVARSLASVRAFHGFLLEEGGARSNPAGTVAGPKIFRGLPHPLSVEEVTALLASPQGGEPAVLRDRAVLEVLYGAGLRVSELVSLDVDDVDVEQGSVRVLGKGGKERLVPLGSFACAAVERYLRGGRPALASRGSRAALFLNRHGRRLTRQGAALIVKTHVRRAGISKRVSPHTLRHSYATHLLEGGADVRIVQELLGHASVATTQVYTLVTQDHVREVYFTSHPRARRDVRTKRGRLKRPKP